ncbi:MAG TPA: hypothetical protein VE968_02240 [Sphingomicrobium sp.]|nr:hypothetical protein [Sphingomicrobium sp.]
MKGMSLAGAAVAVAATTVSASAQPYVNHGVCEQWRHGACVSWHGLHDHPPRRSEFGVGYDFGPNHTYVDVGHLPPSVVARNHLDPAFRYVNENGRLYVVNPRSFRVVRVININ